jgi:hypothetical protein
MTKTAPCGYNDADVVRAKRYLNIDEDTGCHFWTGSGSGKKPRVRHISHPSQEDRYRVEVMVTPRFSLHSKKVKPQQLFYAAANGIAIDSVPQLTCNCPGDGKRLCCNAAHLRPRFDEAGKPIYRDNDPPIPFVKLTPSLMALMGRSDLTQREINDTVAYADEAHHLARLKAMEGDTAEFLTGVADTTEIEYKFTQANVDRYIKEHP